MPFPGANDAWAGDAVPLPRCLVCPGGRFMANGDPLRFVRQWGEALVTLDGGDSCSILYGRSDEGA